MTQKCASLVCLSDTPYYHCVSRCVRRSFLCGAAAALWTVILVRVMSTGGGWVEERLLYLSSVYAIDICAYAVMSNHVHVVVHVDVDKAQGWRDKQVLSLWHTLYKGTLITQKCMRDEPLSPGEEVTLRRLFKNIVVAYMTSVGLCATSMNLLPVKPTKKTVVPADFIRCHPWCLPCGPAKAVLIYSL